MKKYIKILIKMLFGIKTTNKNRTWEKRGNKWFSYTDVPKIVYIANYGYSFNYYHFNDLSIVQYENVNRW